MTRQARGWPQLQLWTRLAAFAAMGVVLTHAAHLVIANRITSHGLAHEQEALGQNIARQIARQAVDAVLVDDPLSLHALVAGAAAGKGVSYCFIVREGRVLATSFEPATPPALVALSREGNVPILVEGQGRARYLDLREPILGGAAGEVRLGLDMAVLGVIRRELATNLGLLAVGVILAGFVAALVVGGGIARPLGELLSAADRFDPDVEPVQVRPGGGLEISRLAERFNEMTFRLRAAHVEQRQTARKASAAERMAALGALVAGVAHEVNNPIAGVKTCLRRLRDERLPPETVDEYHELMEEGVSRVEHVMRRLLDFARPKQTEVLALPLGQLAREGALLLEPLLHERRIVLRELDEELAGVTVLANRKEVGQVLVNLLLNAAYVTGKGGQIRLRLRRRPGQGGLSVEDDGPGIPPEVRPRLGVPFFTTKPEGEGTGLGLTVCRSIAEAHGGELSFEHPPRGCVATLWLPAASADAERAHAVTRPAAPRGP